MFYKLRCNYQFKLTVRFKSVSWVLCHVSIHLPVVHRLKDVIVSRAVVVACTGLDKHHPLLHDLTVGTLEFHREGGCSVGGAATPVSADATELGSVGLHTSAARQLKPGWLGDLGSTNALLAFLLRTEDGIHIITYQMYNTHCPITNFTPFLLTLGLTHRDNNILLVYCFIQQYT